VLLPTGLAAAVAAIAFLVVGTIGAIAVLGDGGRGDGAVLQETSQPVPSVAAAIVPTFSPSPTPSPFPVVIAAPSLAPTGPVVTPIPTVAPTVRPTPRVTPRPTTRPTPRPVIVKTSGPARDPAETVARFYDLVVAHDYDAAAALWSPRMQSEYPPSRYIDGRFDATTRIDIHLLRIERMSVARREAAVYIDITEYRSPGSPRHWVGTWDLVQISGAWRMDDPHLTGG